MVAKLSEEQKTEFFHQGYLVLKDVVPIKLVEEARARIKRAKKGESLAAAEELADLVNLSDVTPILNEAMGEFDPHNENPCWSHQKKRSRRSFHPTRLSR